MKRILLFSILSFISVITYSQGFNQAIGIRGGYSSGFEYRWYQSDIDSYKLLLSARNHGVQLHALKEFHRYDLFDFAYQIVCYYGFGIHGGYESWNVLHYNGYNRWYSSRASVIVGLDGLAGLEYVFDTAPISAGFEVKPFFDLLGRKTFDLQLFDFAFTIKYLF